MPRCGALYRVSTKAQANRQRDGDVDLPGQRAAVERFIAQRQGWVLVEEYVEPGVSVYLKRAAQRPILQKVLADAEGGKFDTLLMFKEDRISRDDLEMLVLIRDLENGGITVWSVSDGQRLSTEGEGFLLTAFKGYAAKKESRKTSERVRNGLYVSWQAGKWAGGKTPYGYDLIPLKDAEGHPIITGTRVAMELVPGSDAWLIRELFSRYLHGYSPRALALWLNKTKPPNHGALWRKQTVHYILGNPLYAGYVRRNVKGIPELTKGRHPPLIDEDTWQSVQAALQQRKVVPINSVTTVYPLSGILKCALCGNNMHGVTQQSSKARRNKYTYHYYRCGGRADKGVCDWHSLSADALEDSFLSQVESLQYDGALRTYLASQEEHLHKRLTDADEARRHREVRRKEIQTALRQLHRAYYELGKLADDDYWLGKEAYDAELTSLADDDGMPVTTVAPSLDTLMEYARNIRVLWAEGTPEERKALASFLAATYHLRFAANPDKTVTMTYIDDLAE